MAGDAYFSLNCSKNFDQIETRIKELYNGGNTDSSYPFIDWDSVKWHRMIEHCTKVSLEFPDTLITIEKKENDWDTWENPFFRYHFKNGKYHIQKSQLVWDKFDEKSLDQKLSSGGGVA